MRNHHTHSAYRAFIRDFPGLLGRILLRSLLLGGLCALFLAFFLRPSDPVPPDLWRDYRLLPVILAFIYAAYFFCLTGSCGILTLIFRSREKWLGALPDIAGHITGIASFFYFLQMWRFSYLERSGFHVSYPRILAVLPLLLFFAYVAAGAGRALAERIMTILNPAFIWRIHEASRKWRRALWLCAVFCFMLYTGYALYGPFPDRPPENGPVPHRDSAPLLVIGLDGFESDMVRLLVGQGRLPVFQRFVDEGSCYMLHPVTPRHPFLVWTAIGSGHNLFWDDIYVLDGEYHADGRFASLPGRKALDVAIPPLMFSPLRLLSEIKKGSKSFWEVGALNKKNALVVNWRGSWPVGPVPGTIISDRTFPGLFKKRRAKNFASPPEVQDELSRRFDTDWRPGALSLSVALPDYFRWELRKFINRTVEIDDYYASICLRYMKKDNYPLTVLYLHGQEALKYALLKDRGKLSLADLSASVKVLESYYVFVDRWLAKILDQFPETGHMVLIGDPGRISTRGDYMATGYLGLMGPHIRPAGFAGYAKELAIAPTLMALMGISPSEEMEEDILEEAFDVHFISELETLGEISSYGRKTGAARFPGREVEGYYRKELSTPEYALWKD